jgi:photosystem II stability/assembly factor-like uncharacterized protein
VSLPKALAVLAALALALGVTACADREFIAEHGSPPPATPGINAWIVSGHTIWHTSDGGAGWTRQLERAPRHLVGIAFADASHGWAVGAQGLILATSDGGASWHTQTSSGPHLWQVACVDARHVWAIGPAGELVSTTDGGASWHTSVVPSVAHSSFGGVGLAFADARRGWIVAGHLICRTSDGGATWALQHRRSGEWLAAVACSDARHAWAVGKAGNDAPLVLATSDGGATWQRQHVGTPGLVYGDFALSAVACCGDRLAWAGSSSQQLLTRTSDGGRTWKVERIPGASVYAMAAANADHVILTTNGQPVLFSGNGGLTWNASGKTHWLDDAAQGVASISTGAE